MWDLPVEINQQEFHVDFPHKIKVPAVPKFSDKS